MSSSHQPLLSSNSNSSSSPTSLCTLLDVLTVPDILARLCCDYLEPRDILTLGLISKRVKVLIDTNPSIWHKMSTAFLGQEVLDKASVVPSSKESFLRLYKLERPFDMSVYNDESNSNTSNNSNNSQPTQIKEQSTQSKSSEQTISEEYYSSLPNVPPPPPPQPHSALQEYSLPTTRQGGAASLLSISINRDANEDEEADVPKSVSGASLSSPSITHLAQPSLLDRSFSSSMRVSNNSSSSGSGSSSGSSSTVGSLGRNQSPRFALRNMGSLIHNNTTISSSVSVSGSNTFSRGNHSVSSSTSGILDLNSLIHEKPITMDDSSSSTSPSAASGLSRLSSRPIVIGHVSQSQPSSPTPAIAQLPISPPSLPKVSERAESPTSQGPALTVIELDKEREEEERRRKEAERDNEAKKKLELKGRLSFRKDPTTHAQSATITIPTQTSLKKDKHKYLSMLQMRKTVIFNEKNTVGTPVASNLEFKAMLELPESKHIKSTIDSFIKGFEKKTKGNPDEEVKNTKLLITATENSMRHHVLWSKLPQNYFVIAKEEMQKYIYTRLYNIIFAKKEYEEKDKWIKKHIEEIRPYLTPQFLELKESYYNNDTLQAAITELNLFESDDFITPREKITAIFNSCRILNFILNSEGSSGGADDFLPLFIYVVGHANLSKLYSNKEYIARYIDPSERFAEPYYYYTHLVSAMNYLEKLTPEKAKEVLKERELKDLETEKAKEIEQEKLDPEGAFLRSESELIAMTKAVKAAIESGTLGNEGDKALIANFIEMSEKLLPHFHRTKSWGQERYIRSDVIFLPPGEVTVTALFLDFGYIWAGLSNGRVAVFSTETYQIVRTLELFDAKKDKKIVSIIQADDTGSPQGEAPSCSRRSAVCVVAETGVVVVVDKLFYRPRRKVLLFPVGVERKVTSVRVAPCRVWVSSVSLEPQCPASTISVVDTNTLRLISTIPVPDEYVCEIAPVVGDTTDSSSNNNNNNDDDDDDDDDSNSGDNSSSSSDGGGAASASHKPHTDLFAWCVTKSRKLVLVSSGSSGDDSVISEVLCSSPTLQGKKLSNLFVSEGRVWYLSGGRVCVVPAGGPAHEHEPKVLYPIPGSDDGRLACLAPVRIPWNAGGDMTEFFVGIGLDGMTRLWNAKDLGAEAVLKDGVTGLKVPKLLATFYDMQSGSALWVTSDKESKSLHIFALKKDEFLNSKV